MQSGYSIDWVPQSRHTLSCCQYKNIIQGAAAQQVDRQTMPGWTPTVKRVDGKDGDRLLYANSLLRSRRFDDARIEAEQYLANDPRSVPGRVTLSLALMGQRHVEEALSRLEEAMALDPLHPQPLLAAGYAHLQNRDAARAEACFSDALSLDPDLPGATLGRAQACQLQGRIDEARQYLSDLLVRHPEMTIARLLLARLHRKSGDLAATVGEVKTVLSMNPGQAGIAEMMPMLIQSQSNHTKYQNPIRMLEAATRFEPTNASAWTWLGRARLQAGDISEAEAAFRAACRLKGGALAASIGLAETLIAQGRLDDARAILDRTPKRGAAMPLVETAYGDICTAQHQHADAARHYCAALMGIPGGREAIAAADKDELADSPSDEVLAQRYRSALSQRTEVAKARMLEQDWQAIGRRFANSAWRLRNRRGGQEMAWTGAPPQRTPRS